MKKIERVVVLFAIISLLCYLYTITVDTSESSVVSSQKVSEPTSDASQEYWKNEQVLGNYFCSRLAQYLQSSDHKLADVTIQSEAKFNMFVINQNDIVSDHIINQGHWDTESTKQISLQLEKYRTTKKLEKHQVTFIDIGANIGWFSTVFSELGYQVISFEPMPQNELLLRKNQCKYLEKVKKQKLKNKWYYFNLGLGEKKDTCVMVSHNINVGDGHTKCGENQSWPNDYSVRAKIQIETLDSIIPVDKVKELNVGVVKMDVESFEKFVILGGKEFFKSSFVNALVIELMNESEESKARSSFVFKTLTSFGFTFGTSFYGPSLTEELALKKVDVVAWKEIM